MNLATTSSTGKGPERASWRAARSSSCANTSAFHEMVTRTSEGS